MSDIVRINGKTFTVGRALAQGLIDAEGNITKKANDLIGPNRVRSPKPARNRDRAKAREKAGANAEPELTADGRLKVKAKVQPLKPKNVTAAGEVIEDEKTLKEIADKAKAIETSTPVRRAVSSPAAEEAKKAFLAESIAEHDALAAKE
jgi:hypothetical protein